MSSKGYFDKVASQWDGMRSAFFSEAIRDRALSEAGVQSGKVAADIGAGTGFMSEGLIDRGLRVIAVDQSDRMLEEMKSRLSGVGGIDYRVGEPASLPIADSSADYVFANMYLHHVDSPPLAIREMARTLKPGGKLVITDMDEHEFEWLKEEHHDRWMGFDRGDVEGWFELAGMRNVVVDCAGEDCHAESGCGEETTSVSIFAASGEKEAAT